ncbi:MAG: ethanolamine utilization acetate kinase EutQ [Candidatus Accumulibacter sp.]|jgi:ethanolamine utilization protein EutQ|nr:ethanolamine utilization acetate kinase EutQ [Accumulibacter sp.]
MKRLITASVVRAEHAAGTRRIAAPRGECIVTPEARTTADQLGIVLSEDAAAVAAADCPQKPPSDSDLAAIRAAVLARLPKGSVPDDVVDQLVRKTVDEQRRKESGAESAAADSADSAPEAAYEAQKIAHGIKLVKGASVRLGLFDGAGRENQVGIADVVTAEDGSAMAAGLMSWEKCFFPWTLNYDEVDFVIEGELHIRCEGQCVVGKPGDVIFIPKNSSIEFGTPSRVRFLYVAYPANWADC